MKNNAQLDQFQQQIIHAIGNRVINQINTMERLLKEGNKPVVDFVWSQVKVFVFESELAYQSVFPSVDTFLTASRRYLDDLRQVLTLSEIDEIDEILLTIADIRVGILILCNRTQLLEAA
jgi:hypothetical protein